jgi:hypothetical protein
MQTTYIAAVAAAAFAVLYWFKISAGSDGILALPSVPASGHRPSPSRNNWSAAGSECHNPSVGFELKNRGH